MLLSLSICARYGKNSILAAPHFRRTTRELPNNVPYAAKVGLIVSCQQSWPHSSGTCFDAIHKELRTTMHQLIDDHFSRYQNLHNRVRCVLLSGYHGFQYLILQTGMWLQSSLTRSKTSLGVIYRLYWTPDTSLTHRTPTIIR